MSNLSDFILRSGGGEFEIGDILQTVYSERTGLDTPLWLPCDGSVYSKSAYPALAGLLPGDEPLQITGSFNPGFGAGSIPNQLTHNDNTIISTAVSGLDFSGSYRRSTNGGATWSNISIGAGVVLGLAHATSNTWFANTHDFSTGQSQSRMTTNNGTSWSNVDLGFGSGGFAGPIVNMGSGTMLCIGSENEIGQGTIMLRRSTNNGTSWATSSSIPSGLEYNTSTSLSRLGNSALLYSHQDFFISHDNGTSWSLFTHKLPTFGYPLSALFTPLGSGSESDWIIPWGASEDGYIVSIDEGETWAYKTSFAQAESLTLFSHMGAGRYAVLGLDLSGEYALPVAYWLEPDPTKFQVPDIDLGYIYTGVAA